MIRGRADAAEYLDSVPAAQIVFQPIVDVPAWTVVGFEALARFGDGAPPPQHLEAAEAAGFREELELLLIDDAVHAASDLPTGGFLTLNASGVTILRPEIGGLLAPLDRPWGLEIYEGATTADLHEIRARVTSLGGQLLVDDAGTPHADEQRIRTLRPDVVKVDRALFWRIADDADARERLRRLLEVARQEGAKVLVEGVSDAAQVQRARDLEADLAQGFLLGMPTPADSVAGMLAELRRSVGVDAAGL